MAADARSCRGRASGSKRSPGTCEASGRGSPAVQLRSCDLGNDSIKGSSSKMTLSSQCCARPGTADSDHSFISVSSPCSTTFGPSNLSNSLMVLSNCRSQDLRVLECLSRAIRIYSAVTHALPPRCQSLATWEFLGRLRRRITDTRQREGPGSQQGVF